MGKRLAARVSGPRPPLEVNEMKQNISRLFGLLALATALVGVLAACGSRSADAPRPEDSLLPAQTAALPEDILDAPETMDAVEPAMELSGDDATPLSSLPENVPAPQTGTDSAPASLSVIAEGPSKASTAPPAPSQPGTSVALTRSEAIKRGYVVLSGKSSVPCYNAGELLAFYEEYRAGRESSVSIYSFRTQNDDERRYTHYELKGAADKPTTMTEDTTHFYDAAEKQSAEDAGVRTLGSFTMTKNKYGFLIVDVDSPDGKLQYHYQVTGYDELYPATVTYAEEADSYLAPLAGTGILELEWSEPSALISAGLFPQAFEAVAGAEAVGDRGRYWSEAQKTYCFPQELVENTLASRFGFSTEQLRALPEYEPQTGTYNYVPRQGTGRSDVRILAAAVPEDTQGLPTVASGESLLQLRYEFFDAESGAPVSRGKVTVLVHEDESFRYLQNELLPPPESAA